MALYVGPYRLDVGDVDHLLGNGNTSKGRVWRRSEQRVAHARLDIGGRGVVRSNRAEDISVSEMQRAELGLADARRVFQHGSEDRFQLTQRTRDDAQDLGACRLLLQRLVSLARSTVELFLETSNG